jgi:hypothetical protein
LAQNEFRADAPLLDRTGRLARAGWARHPYLAYERDAVAAPIRRIKEWDYYCVCARDCAVAFTVADNGYIGLISASVLDFAAGTQATDSYVIPFPLGALSLPASSLAGDVRVRHQSGAVDFALMEGGARIIKVDLPKFNHGAGLRGALVLTPPPDAESIVTAIPWAGKPKAFYYNRKLNCLAAEGMMMLGGKEYGFSRDSACGCLDWGRGVWPYSGLWYWGSLSWNLDGVPFGVNVGAGFGDTSAGTENAIFYDGKLHKLGAATFLTDPRDYLAPWRIVTDDGRLELTLEPSLDRAAKLSAFIYGSNQHQAFGRYSGRAVLDDGRALEFSDLPGFAEKVKNRW